MRDIEAPKCWICGAPATSGEHKFKKSDLVRAYGKQFNRGGSGPAHVKDGKVSRPQGPKAELFKYPPSLCEPCNNSKTQPFDRAYDAFMDWFFLNTDKVLVKRFINFEEVFGPDFQAKQINLYKYFTKSFGCRLVADGCVVPDDLVQLLDQETFPTRLRITFSVNEGLLLKPRGDCERWLNMEGLSAMWDRTNREHLNGYVWQEEISWLTIHYWYDIRPDPGLGAIWVADTRCIYLGWQGDTVKSCSFLFDDSVYLRNSLASEIGWLESILHDLPEGEIIERMGFESRLEEIRERLEEVIRENNE